MHPSHCDDLLPLSSQISETQVRTYKKWLRKGEEKKQKKREKTTIYMTVMFQRFNIQHRIANKVTAPCSQYRIAGSLHLTHEY